MNIIFRPATVIKLGKKPIVKVKLSNHQTIRVTPDHKIYTQKGWQEAGKLKPNQDKVYIQPAMGASLNFTQSKENIGIYHMFGWFSGDGWLTDKKSFGLTFGPKDTHAYKYLLPIWKKFTQTKTKTQTQNNFVRCISIKSPRLWKLRLSPWKTQISQQGSWSFSSHF